MVFLANDDLHCETIARNADGLCDLAHPANGGPSWGFVNREDLRAAETSWPMAPALLAIRCFTYGLSRYRAMADR
jgi:hypothetical protein